MLPLNERRALRAQRNEESKITVGADRDELQAQAEKAVELKDAAAGLESAPLASRSAPAKKAANKGKGKAAETAPPADPFA